MTEKQNNSSNNSMKTKNKTSRDAAGYQFLAMEQLNTALGHRGMGLVNSPLARKAWKCLQREQRAVLLPALSNRERALVGLPFF